jgi:hypothetical protein
MFSLDFEARGVSSARFSIAGMEVRVKRKQWLVAVAIGVTFASLPAIAVAFDAKAARKTCLERYNTEKESGTIPAGMPKSKYLSQCTNSMRRAAKLKQELAEEQAAKKGSNELTTAAQGQPGTTPSTSKPATVATPAFSGPKGQ